MYTYIYIYIHTIVSTAKAQSLPSLVRWSSSVASRLFLMQALYMVPGHMQDATASAMKVKGAAFAWEWMEKR